MPRVFILLYAFIGMIAAVCIVEIISLATSIKELDSLLEGEACWFLSDRAETVLIEDLAAWATHMEHADATMEDYYSVRIPEMLELWSTSGITETEARDCLLSLQVRRKSLSGKDLGIP